MELAKRFSPTAEVAALRNPAYAFSISFTPRLAEVGAVLGPEAVTTLLQAHILNYARLNKVSLPEGGSAEHTDALLAQMAEYLYDAAKYWTVGEMLYFFAELNRGTYGDEQYVTPQTLTRKAKQYDKVRQEQRAKYAELRERAEAERKRLAAAPETGNGEKGHEKRAADRKP